MMQKRLTLMGVFALAQLPLLVAAGAPGPDVMELLKGLEGKPAWLRVDVVRVQWALGGTDATNIYPDGHVRYAAHTGGLRSTESTSVEEFTKDVQHTMQQNKKDGQVRLVGRGSPVTVAKAEAEKDAVVLELRDSGGSKHKIRLKFNDRDYAYSADDVRRLLAVVFADTEAQAKGEKPTASLQLGMTVDEVIAIKGSPKTRVDLGSKVILTYEDLKITFERGKLTDVQ
jgi:hypothetical protein